MVTPLLKVLKDKGCHVTYNTTEKGVQVLKYNPNIDKFLFQKTNQVRRENLEAYWAGLSKDYDIFINLSESIEVSLLKLKGSEEWNWTHEKRDEALGRINYYDRAFDIAGFDIKGKLPELHFSPLEESMARSFRKKMKGKFVILWSLSGSSFHKAYPYSEIVAQNLLDNYDDIVTVTVGDGACTLLEWNHPRAKSYSGKWSIRKSLIMTKYADLVIAAETGIANASGCFDTPKIIMLSHSSRDNLTKYFKNCISLEADAPCHPCHKLHYSLDTCLTEPSIKSPICMAWLPSQKVYDSVINVYKKWKEKKNASDSIQRTLCLSH